MKRISLIGVALIGVLLAACQSHTSRPVTTSATIPKAEPATLPSPSNAQALFGPPSNQLLSVNVLQLAAPAGTISENNEFWKLVDEDAIDPAERRLLGLNGVRAGMGNLSDWTRFRETLDKENCYSRATRFSTLPGTGTCMLDLVGEIPGQTLFVYNPHQLGRTYGECQNFFYMEFNWTPHAQNSIRASISPVVLARRTRNDFVISDNPPDETVTIPETFYDIGLRADIPANQFLVIGPSPQARDSFRLGYHFLMIPHSSELLEQVVIIVGKEVELDNTKKRFYPVQPGTLTRN